MALLPGSKRTQTYTKNALSEHQPWFLYYCCVFAVVTRLCFSWRRRSAASSSDSSSHLQAPQQPAAPTLNMSERFFFFFNGLTASQKWKKLQMIRVLTYRRRVCFVITRLLHNKRGVLRGETDKHLDKLNKAIAQSFWGWSVFIFRVLRLVRTRELVCLFGVFFCKRFVESVRKTNYILTFLHVFVFAPAVEFICGYTTGQFVIRGDENTLCVLFSLCL